MTTKTAPIRPNSIRRVFPHFHIHFFGLKSGANSDSHPKIPTSSLNVDISLRSRTAPMAKLFNSIVFRAALYPETGE
jgi:hypothetical protein